MKKHHFQKRAEERFNIKIKPRHHKDIINKIKKGKLRRVKEDRQADLYETFIDNKMVIVVYDRTKEVLKTILFPTTKTVFKHNKKRGYYENHIKRSKQKEEEIS